MPSYVYSYLGFREAALAISALRRSSDIGVNLPDKMVTVRDGAELGQPHAPATVSVGLTIAGLTGSLHFSVVVLVAIGIFISCGTGGTFALVPLLFPDRPGAAAGFIGGVSTAAGIVYPLVFSGVPNIHMRYLYVALYLFLPFVLFYFWATRYERHPEEHGLLTQVFAVEEA